MVSLAQMTIAGFAAYMLAIFGTSSNAAISLGWPWWLALAFALVLATLFAAAIGWLSVRTEGIYTIMITLAVGVAFFYLAQQNYTLFNGFQGFSRIAAPTVFDVDLHEPKAFYLLALACALGGYFFVKHVARTPFGIALQGIRDNPRRMQSLGYHVTAHRVGAHAVAGLLAAVGGVLMVWYNGRISPGTVGTGAMINILIIAVLGGMKHPIGAFIGAVVFVLLQNFAIDLVDRERFNLVIGGVFLAIVLFSPDGLLGLWQSLRERVAGRFTHPRHRPHPLSNNRSET
jgi:branched-chain amino acid transport system permease protein